MPHDIVNGHIAGRARTTNTCEANAHNACVSAEINNSEEPRVSTVSLLLTRNRPFSCPSCSVVHLNGQIPHSSSIHMVRKTQLSTGEGSQIKVRALKISRVTR